MSVQASFSHCYPNDSWTYFANIINIAYNCIFWQMQSGKIKFSTTIYSVSFSLQIFSFSIKKILVRFHGGSYKNNFSANVRSIFLSFNGQTGTVFITQIVRIKICVTLEITKVNTCLISNVLIFWSLNSSDFTLKNTKQTGSAFTIRLLRQNRFGKKNKKIEVREISGPNFNVYNRSSFQHID